MLNTDNPFAFYPDSSGHPLQNGVVYFGLPGLNPATNPVTVFWDSAGTQPAAQPVAISNGRTVRQDGTPSRIWVMGDYSKLVQDAKGRQVVYETNQPQPPTVQQSVTDRFSGTGAPATFTLSATPADATCLDVFVAGVYQQKNSYTLVGNQLTITAAAAANNVEAITRNTLNYANVAQSIALSLSTSLTGAAAATASAAAAAHIYAGTYASDPSTRPDGTPIQAGDVYFTTAGVAKSYASGVWAQVPGASPADLASGSDPAKGATLVGYRGTSLRTAMDVAWRQDRNYLNANRQFENTMDSFLSVSTADAPTITYTNASPSATSTTIAGVPVDVSSASWGVVGPDHVVTVTTVTPHGFEVGKAITVSGAVQPEYNGTKTAAANGLTITGSRTFTYKINASAFPTSPATGTLTCTQAPHFTRAPESVFSYSLGRALMTTAAGSGGITWLAGYNEMWSPVPFAVEFLCLDDSFEFVMRRSVGGIRLLVDGFPVSGVRLTPTDTAFPAINGKVVFALARPRVIRMEFTSSSTFIGVWTRLSRHVKRYEAKPKPRCLFLGDSFGEGTGATNGRFGALCAYIGRKMGWEIINGSLGSTGITTVGTQGAGMDYIGRMRAQYASLKPDIVFVMGSVNDSGNITTANAGALFDAIAQLAPNAKILAFGPTWPTSGPAASLVTSADNLRDAAVVRGIPYLDGGIGLDGAAQWLNSSTQTLVYYNGTQAAANASLGGGSTVTGITVATAGEGYDPHDGAPAVSLTGGGGTGAAATAVMNYRVNDLILLNGGSGYTSAPTVTIGGGATANCSRTGTSLLGITVTNEGAGYMVPPTVSITGGGGGSGATATAVIEGGRVVRIDLTAAGTGYTSDPTITLTSSTSDATATATVSGGVVTGLTLTGSGSFYTSCPQVTFSGGGSGAGGAEAVAFLSGTVDSITVTNAGSGYTSAPAVTVPHPTLGDVTHPKENGHQMLAARICAQLATLVLF